MEIVVVIPNEHVATVLCRFAKFIYHLWMVVMQKFVIRNLICPQLHNHSLMFKLKLEIIRKDLINKIKVIFCMLSDIPNHRGKYQDLFLRYQKITSHDIEHINTEHICDFSLVNHGASLLLVSFQKVLEIPRVSSRILEQNTSREFRHIHTMSACTYSRIDQSNSAVWHFN